MKFTFQIAVSIFAFIVGISTVWLAVFFHSSNLNPKLLNDLVAVQSPTNILLQRNEVSLKQLFQEKTPLPCTDSNDLSKPWVHHSEVLESFPPGTPVPRYIGTFRDKRWRYQLNLFQDEKGIFGEISSPVLEAESPTSRLYDTVFDPANGSLQFTSFNDGRLQFTGSLGKRVISGWVARVDRTEKVKLQRIHWYNESPYTSRAQFDCAMKLFRRS